MLALASAAVPVVSAVVHASASAHAAVIHATATVSRMPPVSVSIDNSPKVQIEDSKWVIFAALASAAAAIATAIMAVYTRTLATATRRLAEETRRLAEETLEGIKVTRQAIDAEDRRHMDSFMPHLRLEVRDVPEQGEKYVAPGALITFRPRTIELWVSNIGAGFAQKIRVDEGPERIEQERPPTGLGVDQQAQIFSRAFDPRAEIEGYHLTYEDAFGRSFESVIDGPITIGSRYRWRRLGQTPTAPPQST
jgi:hypothetical protein